MKKRLSVFLCAAAAMLMGSCSDYSISQEERYELPGDFKWQVYAEINKDIAMSQIILDVREKNKAYRGNGETVADSTAKAVSNCVNLLSDNDFAKKVYLEYASCPEQAWAQGDRCPGGRPVLDTITTIVSGDNRVPNPNYGDTISWQCGGCWAGGWAGLSSELPTELTKFTGASSVFAPIRLMCFFLPKAETSEVAENYLKSFYHLNNNDEVVYNSNFDFNLVQQHYFLIGRFDGRPYKYCEAGQTAQEKSLDIADRRVGYYDYGKYTFCLNKSDDKIYVVK
ncbi:MAG: hypothetical protein FWC15_05105 [Fibromonadales bacterium]|nr:hypothetical protein [Fibromonadales bacterium]